MAYSEFDVDGLARYLHILPQQVVKLAEQGKLPGRKVGGQWRFPEVEIHAWLERQIGASDEEKLVKMEGVLARHAPAESPVRIADLLPLEAIAVPLLARTRNSVIESMTELAAKTGWLWDPKEMAQALRLREDVHPTAMENGVALLHPRKPMTPILAQPFLALGCTTSGIPFASNMPLSDVFFLICSMEDREHLRVLARLSRLLNVPGFLNGVHRAEDPRAVRELIVEAEEKL